jgi:hypothetical protein
MRGENYNGEDHSSDLGNEGVQKTELLQDIVRWQPAVTKLPV